MQAVQSRLLRHQARATGATDLIQPRWDGEMEIKVRQRVFTKSLQQLISLLLLACYFQHGLLTKVSGATGSQRPRSQGSQLIYVLVSSLQMQVGRRIPLRWDCLFNGRRTPGVRLRLMRYCHGFASCSSSFNVAVPNEFLSVAMCEPGLPMPSQKSHAIPISRSEGQIVSLSDDRSMYVSHRHPTLIMIN